MIQLHRVKILEKIWGLPAGRPHVFLGRHKNVKLF